MARPRTIKFYIKLYKETGNIEEIPEEFRDEVKNIVGDKIKKPRVKKVENRKKALKPTDKRFGVRQSTIDKYIETAKTGDLFGVKPKYRTPKIVAIAKKSAKKSGDYSKIPPELLTVDEAIRRYKKTGKMNGLTETVKKGLYEYIAKTTGSLVGIKKSERTEELSGIAKNAKKTMNVSKKKKAKTKKYYGPRKKTEEKYMELAKSGNLIDIPAYQRDDKKTNIALDVAREKKDFSKIPPRVLGISDAILRYELTGKASGLADNIKNDMYVYVIKKSATLAPIPVKDRSEKLKALLKEVKKENAYKKRKELIAKKRKTKHYGPTEETKEKIMALAKAGNLKGIPHVHRSDVIIGIAKAAAKAKRDYSLIPSELLNVEEAIDRFKLTGKANNLAPDVRQRVYKYIIAATHSLDGIPIAGRKKDVLKLYRELTRGENKNENESSKEKTKKYLKLAATGNLRAIPAAERTEEMISMANAWGEEHEEFKNIPTHLLSIKLAIIRYEKTKKATHLSNKIENQVYRYIVEKTLSLDGIPHQGRSKELREYRKKLIKDKQKAEKMARQNILTKTGKKVKFPTQYVALSGKLNSFRDEDITPEMIGAANNWAISHKNFSGLPTKYMSLEAAIEYLTLTRKLNKVPEQFKDEIYKKHLENGGRLADIPYIDRSEELTIIYILQNGNLHGVPDEYKNRFSIYDALFEATGSIRNIPAQFRTEAMSRKVRTYKKYHYRGGTVRVEEHQTIEAARKKYAETGSLVGITYPHQKRIAFGVIKDLLGQKKGIVGFAHECGLNPVQFKLLINDLGIKNGIKAQYHERIRKDLQTLEEENNATYLPLAEQLNTITESLNFSTKALTVEQKIRFSHLTSVLFRKRDYRNIEMDDVYKYLYLVGKQDEYDSFKEFCELKLGFKDESQTITVKKQKDEKSDIKYREWYTEFSSKEYFKNERHTFVDKDGKKVEITRKMVDEILKTLANANITPFSCIVKEAIRLFVLGQLTAFIETMKEDEFAFKKGALRKYTVTTYERKIEQKPFRHGIDISTLTKEGLIVDIEQGTPRSLTYLRMVSKTGNLKKVPVNERIDVVINAGLEYAKNTGNYDGIPGPCLTVEAAIDRYERTGVATKLASDVQGPVYRYIIEKTGSLDGIPANKVTEELKQYCLQVNPDADVTFRASSEEKEAEYEKLANEGNLKDIKAKDRSPELTKKALDVAIVTHNYSNIPGSCLTVEAAIDRYEQTGDLTYLNPSIKKEVYTYVIRKTCSLKPIPPRDRNKELRQLWLDTKKERRAEKVKETTRKPRVKKSAEVRNQEKIERYREFIERADYNGIPSRAKGDKTLLPLVLARAAEIGDYSNIPGPCLTVEAAIDRYERTGVATNLASDVQDPVYRYIIEKTGSLDGIPANKVTEELKQYCLQVNPDADVTFRASSEEKEAEYEKLANEGNLKDIRAKDRTPELTKKALDVASVTHNYSNIPGSCLTVEAAIDRYEQTGDLTYLNPSIKKEVYTYVIRKTCSLKPIPLRERNKELRQLWLDTRKEKRAEKAKETTRKPRVKKSAEVRNQEKIERYREFIERADYNGIPNRAKGDKTLLTLVLARAAEIGDYSRIPVKYLDPATIEKLKEAKKSKATDGAKKKRTAKAAKTKKGSVSPKDIEIIEVAEKSDDKIKPDDVEIIEVSDDKIKPDDVEIIEVSDDKIKPDDIKIIDSGSEKAKENTEINTDIVFADDVPENIKKLLFDSLSPFERKFICLIYGLETGMKSTIKQAGETLGMDKNNAYNTRRIIVAKHPKLIEEIRDFTKQKKKDINEEINPDKSITLIDNVPEEIRKLISRIPKARHREIICLHYGLKDGKKYSFRQMSDMFGISSQRIQQIDAELAIKHKALMTKIREFANVPEETAPAVTRVEEETERKQIVLNTYNRCATYIEQTGRLIDIPSEFQSDEGLIKLARIYALRNNNFSGVRKEHMNYLMCINYINEFHSLDMVPEKHRILQLMLYYAYCSGNFDCDPEWHEKGEIRAIYDIVKFRTDFMRKLGNPYIRVELSDFPTLSREKAAAYFAKDEAHDALLTSSARAQISKLEDAKAKLGIIAEKANTSANNIQSVVPNGDGEDEQAPKNPMKTIERPN